MTVDEALDIFTRVGRFDERTHVLAGNVLARELLRLRDERDALVKKWKELETYLLWINDTVAVVKMKELMKGNE